MDEQHQYFHMTFDPETGVDHGWQRIESAFRVVDVLGVVASLSGLEVAVKSIPADQGMDTPLPTDGVVAGTTMYVCHNWQQQTGSAPRLDGFENQLRVFPYVDTTGQRRFCAVLVTPLLFAFADGTGSTGRIKGSTWPGPPMP